MNFLDPDFWTIQSKNSLPIYIRLSHSDDRGASARRQKTTGIKAAVCSDLFLSGKILIQARSPEDKNGPLFYKEQR